MLPGHVDPEGDSLSHVEEALALLPERDQQPVIQAILTALVKPLDELEAAAAQVRMWRDIDSATGQVLDQIGRILRVRRGGDSDDVYRLRLHVQILVLRSDGLPETLIKIVRAAVAPPAGAILLRTYAAGSATIQVNTELFQGKWSALALAVKKARAAGISLMLRLRSWYYPSVYASARGGTQYPGKLYGYARLGGTYSTAFWHARST